MSSNLRNEILARRPVFVSAAFTETILRLAALERAGFETFVLRRDFSYSLEEPLLAGRDVVFLPDAFGLMFACELGEDPLDEMGQMLNAFEQQGASVVGIIAGPYGIRSVWDRCLTKLIPGFENVVRSREEGPARYLGGMRALRPAPLHDLLELFPDKEDEFTAELLTSALLYEAGVYTALSEQLLDVINAADDLYDPDERTAVARNVKNLLVKGGHPFSDQTFLSLVTRAAKGEQRDEGLTELLSASAKDLGGGVLFADLRSLNLYKPVTFVYRLIRALCSSGREHVVMVAIGPDRESVFVSFSPRYHEALARLEWRSIFAEHGLPLSRRSPDELSESSTAALVFDWPHTARVDEIIAIIRQVMGERGIAA